MTQFTAAVIQMRSGKNPEQNAVDLAEGVREAAARGAVYVQSPEMTGALHRDRDGLLSVLKPTESDIIVKTASSLAGECGIYLHVGSTAIALSDGKVANRAFVFGPDGHCVATYDKIHMFDVDLDNGESWRESKTYRGGSEALVVDLPMMRLGLAICYDVRFGRLFEAQALAGAEVLTVPAAFTRQTGEAHWHVLLRARAIEGGAWVIAAAQGGRHEDGRETFGHSMIIDPWGRIVAEADGDRPCVVTAQIDTAQSTAARSKIPNLKNARAFTMSSIAALPEGTRRAS